jgi:hypothetical protein
MIRDSRQPSSFSPAQRLFLTAGTLVIQGIGLGLVPGVVPKTLVWLAHLMIGVASIAVRGAPCEVHRMGTRRPL